MKLLDFIRDNYTDYPDIYIAEKFSTTRARVEYLRRKRLGLKKLKYSKRVYNRDIVSSLDVNSIKLEIEALEAFITTVKSELLHRIAGNRIRMLNSTLNKAF